MSDFQQAPPMTDQAIHAIRIFFFAILTGTIMFSVIVVGLQMIKRTVSPIKQYESIALGVAILISAICYSAARNGYNKSITLAKESLMSLPDKLTQCRTTSSRYMA